MRGSIYFIIAVIIILLTGCASLGKLASDVGSIDKETEVNPVIDSISNIISSFIPSPFNIPVAVGVGYIIALLRRKYKKAKGSVN